jgi:glutamate-ammonia-ligase adenylyltransferase
MAATLSDNTDQGYVFRTDLRLRPDAAVTPVCISISAALAYYEAEGRTWERAPISRRGPARRSGGGRAVPARICAPLSGAGIWISPPFRTPMTCGCASANTRVWRAA